MTDPLPEPAGEHYRAVHDPECFVRTMHLTKSYGPVRALDDISIEVRSGDIFGLVGPNGAGKTTLMKILSTLIKPDKGVAYVCGNSVWQRPSVARLHLGFMPDYTGIYEDLKVVDYLEFFAQIYRLPAESRGRRIREILLLTRLFEKQNANIRALSRGMQQRLHFGRLLLHDPDVLLLDEPTSGLDPHARADFLTMLEKMRHERKAVILSSHILPDLDRVCNRVGILEKGRLLFSGTLPEAGERIGGAVRFRLRPGGDVDSVASLLASRPQTRDAFREVRAHDAHLDLYLNDGTRPGDIGSMLLDAGVRILALDQSRPTLEEVFMGLTKGTVS
ncbi:MAG: ABC transporter ATP-binding protein [Planctomycetes bacterium]|nr:ABC transporter ATP-binding protein [Planctomycetota bacterium]